MVVPFAPPMVGAALENFPVRKQKQKFWFHVRKKNRSKKKCHEEQFVPPPKLVISTFDDGGQYPPRVINILRY
jgi:hypothetical protein